MFILDPDYFTFLINVRMIFKMFNQFIKKSKGSLYLCPKRYVFCTWYFASFNEFAIGFWNCSIVWYLLFIILLILTVVDFYFVVLLFHEFRGGFF